MRSWLMLALMVGFAPCALEAQTVSDLVAGNTQFAVDLFGQIRNEPGNLFYSPVSISTALAMTSMGARGETAQQMARVLHLSGEHDDVAASFAALNKSLNAGASAGGYRLSIANRLWGQQGQDFVPAFLSTARTQFDADLIPIDFVSQPEAARQQINTWVADKTQQKITNLISSGTITPLTRLVLTNAIYFKGDWAKPFSKQTTQEADFHVSSDKTTKAPLMTQTTEFGYWGGDGLKLLELNYAKSDLSMVVILPDDVNGLPELEVKLSAANLDQWIKNIRQTRVQAFLPRFKATSEFLLKDVLAKLGMPLAFDPARADFSGISRGEKFSISAVIHKAFVDVNEEGTEAAAATGVAMVARSAVRPQAPPVFRADHPFLYLIRERTTGSILFLGRMRNPNG